MTYDRWKLATPPEYEREEQDDDDVVVRPPLWAACRLCGEPDAMPPDPLCDRCKYERHCADNGEGDDMQDPDTLIPNRYPPADASVPAFDIERWIAAAPLLQLKRASILIETQVERRKAENEAERKELEKFDKPVRARRSDAGRPRAAKENAA